MAREILLIVMALAFMAAGLVGVFFPILPGPPLAWVGLFLYAYATGFREVSTTAVFWLGGLAFLTLVMDLLVPVLGLKTQKASWKAVLGSILGTFVGVAFFGPVGIIVGPFLGAFLGELSAGRELHHATRSAFGTLVSFVVNSLLKVGIVFVIAGYFIYALIF